MLFNGDGLAGCSTACKRQRFKVGDFNIYFHGYTMVDVVLYLESIYSSMCVLYMVDACELVLHSRSRQSIRLSS